MRENTVILTPNKRLARHLQSYFCREIFNTQKKIVWHSINILPLATWLTNLWYEIPNTRILLTSIQEQLVWKNILDCQPQKNHIGLTELLMEFHMLIQSWQIDISTFTNHTSEDITTGQHFYKLFKNYCKHKKLITNNELLTALLPHIPRFKFTEITFAGFDEYTPQLQKFITILEQNNCKVNKFDPNQQKANHKLIALDNSIQELTISASWAKQLLHKNLQCNIGIVIPNLLTLRSQVVDIFGEVFGNNKDINISAGISLNTLPIINYALEFLALEQPFTITTLNQILLSPYTAGFTSEKTTRILFNQQLRQIKLLPMTLQEVIGFAQKHKINIPIILDIFQTWLITHLSIRKKYFSNLEWAKTFTQILQIWGWPGGQQLNNNEAAAVKTFEKLLQAMAATHTFIDKIPLQQALQTLRTLIANTYIQTQLEFDVPINIMGALEATGINFDYLWVMGLDEEHWPSNPTPNPFIPYPLQKKYFLPHSSHEREYQFYNTLIQRYKRSAKELIFSYVKQLPDRTIGPSTLIATSPITSVEELNLSAYQTQVNKIYISKTTETIQDPIAPPLQPDEISYATSRLVELQALCPFRAFAELRLHVTEQQIPNLGIKKKDTGTIVHQVLEKFWYQTKTQENLKAISITKLKTMLIHNIKQTLANLELTKIVAQLETKRLTLLLLDWLEIEKKRSSFQVVATEKPAVIQFSSLPIHIRVDRIDQLSDGTKILLDYKTGKNLPAVYDWFGTRPKNLQLPLYSLAIDSIAGLALAQINEETIKLKIITLPELLQTLQKIDPHVTVYDINTWEKLIINWRTMCDKLITEFAQGQAAVNPISPQVCTYCRCAAICRIASV